MKIKLQKNAFTKPLSCFAFLIIFSSSFLTNSMASDTKKSSHLPFSFAEVDRMELNFQNELAGEVSRTRQLNKFKSGSRKISGDLALDSEEDLVEQFIELSRINVLIGVFTAFDLEIVEFKIQPYVEMRFVKP